MTNLSTYLRTINFLRLQSLLPAIALVILNFISTIAQDLTKADSLRQYIESCEALERYDPLIALIRLLVQSDYHAALIVANEASALALQYGDSAKIVQSGRIKGQLLNNLERRNEGFEVLTRTLPIAERHNFRDEYKTILNNIANIHVTRAEYSKALNFHFHLLALQEDDKDGYGTSLSLGNIGAVYYKIKNFTQAISFYERAIALRLKINDHHDITSLFINIGLCYNETSQFEKVREYFNKAFAYCLEDCNPEALARLHHGIGISYIGTNEFELARQHFQTSLELSERLGNRRSVAENLLALGRIDIAESKLSEAKNKLITAKSIAKEEKYTDVLVSIYYQLAIMSEEQQDYKNSVQYLKLNIILNDSIYNERVFDDLAQIKTDYEQRENLAIIKSNDLMIAQQKKQSIFTMVIAFLSSFLVIVLFFSNRVIRKINKELISAKDLIFEQNRKLEIKNKDLDQLVEKKTTELKLTNLSLKEANNELNSFINRTAEEIRAPLASLKGICHVAQLDIQHPISLLYLDKIDNTTEELSTLLKRLLILNKINHSKITPIEINIKNIVDNIIAKHQKKSLPHNLTLIKDIAENAIVHSDHELLCMVLENSIDNAISICNNSPRETHFMKINVWNCKNGRVNIRITHNGMVTNEYNSEELYDALFDAEYRENSEDQSQDLHFIKTASRKIGGKVEFKKTHEGYNELSVIF